jgi:hypothetical protein
MISPRILNRLSEFLKPHPDGSSHQLRTAEESVKAESRVASAGPTAEVAAPPPAGLKLVYADSTSPIGPEAMARLLEKVAPYTMVHSTGIEFLAAETVRLIRSEVKGDLVECGTWLGGSSLAMLLAQKEVFGEVLRPVWMLDSFQGLPPVTRRDGPLAEDWQRGAQPDKFLNNCRVSEDKVREIVSDFGFSQDEAHIVPGWFADTLPRIEPLLGSGGIALLRLDGDWYDSTLECLERLEPLVQDEGTVIVDDYYAWDGCARAVHDYLSARDLPYRIKSLYGNFGMYFTKRAFRKSFEQF